MDLDKPALFAAWRQVLLDRLAALRPGQQAAQAGTRVDGQHRPANRGERAAVTSQGYLAHALAERIAALESTLGLLARMDPAPRTTAVLGAVLAIEDEDGAETWYALLPGGQGDRLTHNNSEILVVSPQSPIGAAVSGLAEGDTTELLLRGTSIELELTVIR